MLQCPILLLLQVLRRPWVANDSLEVSIVVGALRLVILSSLYVHCIVCGSLLMISFCDYNAFKASSRVSLALLIS